MGTSAEKLLYLNGTKTAIKNAIEAKGVEVPAETTFREYATKIGEISSSGGDVYGDWVRPSDWLAMPDMVETDQKIAVLVAVYENGGNFVSMLCRGAYTVDPGDGSAPIDVASGVKWDYQYSYSSLPASSWCSRGYRQALMIITPQAGQNLTDVNFATRPTGMTSRVTKPFLDIRMAGQHLATYSFYSVANATLGIVEKIEFVGDWVIAGSLDWCFALTPKLGYISPINAENGTSFVSVFYECGITASPITKYGSGSFENMYLGTKNLINVTVDVSGCSSVKNIFNASGAMEVTFVGMESCTVTDGSNIFSNLTNCRKITGLNMSLFTTNTFLSNSSNGGLNSLEQLPGFVPPKVNFLLRYTSLQASALNEIFSNLDPTVTATFTCSNNPGSATCDPSLAPPSWTIVR